nr:MAG: hypothetical protein [Microviridae sp.]
MSEYDKKFLDMVFMSILCIQFHPRNYVFDDDRVEEVIKQSLSAALMAVRIRNESMGG